MPIGPNRVFTVEKDGVTTLVIDQRVDTSKRGPVIEEIRDSGVPEHDSLASTMDVTGEDALSLGKLDYTQ